MPDVEVKLNIEAEYKQALAAIAAMAKALDAVKAKADALKGALGGAGGGADTKPDAGSTEAINALNKANRELAQALLLVNQTAEKAKAALAGFSEISGVTPDMVDSLRAAAAEFANVAAGALQAAESATKFHAALSPGTEQLMKQAEAIKAQVAALQETVELTQKQLEQRINLTAILNESIELHKQETEEIGRNTEAHEDNQRSRKRNTEDSEKERFEMELSLLTRQQLLEKIKELTKARQEAAEAEDQENYELYTRQLSQAHAQLRKTNMEMNVHRMMYLQQAQAVRAMGDTFEELSENIENIGEDAEEGELDLVGMAEGAMELFNQFQAGMGPMGWFMLGLKALQSVLNNYFQTQKQIAELEEENAEILQSEADLYNDLKTARADYEEEVKNSKTLSALKDEYEAIKTTLSDSLSIIEESTRAELVRLSLVKEEEEFKRMQQRYELGRAYKKGDISEEEYNLGLIKLDEEKDLADAEKQAEEARIKIAKQKEKAEKLSASAKEAEDKINVAFSNLNKYKVTDEEISLYEGKISKQNETALSIEKRFLDFAEDKGYSQEDITQMLTTGLTIGHMNKYKIFGSEFFNVKHLLDNRRAALDSAEKLKKELAALLGGRSVNLYKSERDLAKQNYDLAKSNYDDISQEARSAWSDYRRLPTDEYIEKGLQHSRRGIAITYNEKRADIENDKIVKEEREKHRRIIKDARQGLSEMSTKTMKELAKKYAEEAKTETNQHARALFEELSSIYSEGFTQRKESKASNLQIGRNKYIDDGKFTLKEAKEVIELLKKSIAKKDAEAIEVYSELLRLGEKIAVGKQTLAIIKKQNKSRAR